MAKTYISDITHFLDDAGELKEIPAVARGTAGFLVSIIEDSDDLPDPDVLAQEIVDDVQTALEQFSAVMEGLI